jgi:chromate transporter
VLANSNSIWMKALREGLAPVAIGLTFATAIVLIKPWVGEWRVWALMLFSTAVAYFTRLAPLYSIIVGAIAGGFGFLQSVPAT